MVTLPDIDVEDISTSAEAEDADCLKLLCNSQHRPLVVYMYNLCLKLTCKFACLKF